MNTFGYSLDYIWIQHGLHLDTAWTAFGYSMDYIWIQHGLHLGTAWTAFGS